MAADTLFDVSAAQLGDNRVVKGGFVRGEVGAEQRLINWRGEATKAETVSVSFASYVSGRPEVIVGATNAQPAGVGYIEFASGGGIQSRIEFDLPMPRHRGGPNLAGAGASLMPNREQIPNVLVVTVSAASVVAGARLDTALRLIHDPNVSIGPLNTQNVLSPPALPAAADPNADLTVSLRVSAWLSRFPSGGVQGVKLRRTGFITHFPAAAFAVAAAATVLIPQMARRVRFPRRPVTESLSVTMTGAATASGPFTVPANSVGPLDIQNDASSMVVTNTGANPITELAAEFELEI